MRNCFYVCLLSFRFDLPLLTDVHMSHHGLPGSFQNDPISLTSPTPAPKMAASGIRISGKENGKPEISTGLHIRRPAPLATHVLPSQIFYDASFNPLYNPSYAQPHGYGDSQFHFKDSMKSPGCSSSFNGDFRPTTSVAHNRESHPQATIASTTGGRSGASDNHDMHFEM